MGKQAQGPTGGFQTTHWSLVLAAGQEKTAESSDALASLCLDYWYPLFAYARRKAPSLEEAQDLTQGFFTELLEKNYVAAASPERGRFRAFLLTAFQRYMAKQWRRDRAQKRGGARTRLPLDFTTGQKRYKVEIVDHLNPEQIYDRQWAATLLDHVMGRLAEEYRKTGKSEYFDALEQVLLEDGANQSYGGIAAALGTSEPAARMAAHRMRKRFRSLLRDEIARTVDRSDEVELEIMSLFQAFAQESPGIRVAPVE